MTADDRATVRPVRNTLAVLALMALVLLTGAGQSDAQSRSALCDDWETRHPEWIFCDDFESDGPLRAPDRYFEYGDADGDFVPANGVGVDGSRGMRARFREGTVGAGGLKLAFGRNPNGYMNSTRRSDEDFREVYYRMDLRMQPGWTGNPAKLSRATIFTSSSDWSQAMIAHLWGDGEDHLLIDPVRCIDDANRVKCRGYNDFQNMSWLGNRAGVTPIFSPDLVGRWHSVEAHVRLNDPGRSNGVQEFWIDGNLEARREGLDFVRSYTEYGINAIFFENYWNAGSPQDQERYFDNIVVSTERVGRLGAPPSPSPTTATATAPATLTPPPRSPTPGPVTSTPSPTEPVSTDASIWLPRTSR